MPKRKNKPPKGKSTKKAAMMAEDRKDMRHRGGKMCQ